MYLIIAPIIAILLPAFIIIELIRINLLKKDNNALLTGLISMISIGFGLFLTVSNSLVLDYGTIEEINSSSAELMSKLGVLDVLIGFVFILISITKWIFGKR